MTNELPSGTQTSITTSFDQVKAKFVVTETMDSEYRRWQGDPERRHVVNLVREHTTCVLYQLTPQDVQEVCSATEHPLGDIKKAAIKSVKKARDWYPSFAFTHLFHHLMETRGHLPYWQDFYQFLFKEEEGYQLFGKEVANRKKVIERSGVSPRIAGESLKWRIGLSYYSFLREVYSVIALRSRGVDLRVHPLADALFRTDAWMGDIIISLWVSNELFRSKGAGRKKRVQDLLRGASPGFHYLDITLDRATEFGEVHLPSTKAIDEAATTIMASERRHGDVD
ncbi:hypothetical protein ACWGE0_00210 [Lentzea sp. NPDC054927]